MKIYLALICRDGDSGLTLNEACFLPDCFPNLCVLHAAGCLKGDVLIGFKTGLLGTIELC